MYSKRKSQGHCIKFLKIIIPSPSELKLLILFAYSTYNRAKVKTASAKYDWSLCFLNAFLFLSSKVFAWGVMFAYFLEVEDNFSLN